MPKQELLIYWWRICSQNHIFGGPCPQLLSKYIVWNKADLGKTLSFPAYSPLNLFLNFEVKAYAYLPFPKMQKISFILPKILLIPCLLFFIDVDIPSVGFPRNKVCIQNC